MFVKSHSVKRLTSLAGTCLALVACRQEEASSKLTAPAPQPALQGLGMFNYENTVKNEISMVFHGTNADRERIYRFYSTEEATARVPTLLKIINEKKEYSGTALDLLCKRKHPWNELREEVLSKVQGESSSKSADQTSLYLGLRLLNSADRSSLPQTEVEHMRPILEKRLKQLEQALNSKVRTPSVFLGNNPLARVVKEFGGMEDSLYQLNAAEIRTFLDGQ